MDWCKSPIPEAIQKAKVKGSMFLVYIYGTDDQSDQMNTVWDSEAVTGWINESGAVAVRILSSSEECKFFSQIYPVVCVPSTYCIGEGGVPLEVIGGQMSTEVFMNKLKTAQQTHELKRKENQGTSNTSASSPSSPAGGMAVPDSRIVQETSPSTSMDMPGSGQAGASGDQTSLNAKLERAKELIAKKQEERAKQEFEKKHEEEIGRRKLGKDLHKLKQDQQELQMKEIKDQLKKDKEEEKKAKEKIRAQIARDREERASKYQKEKKEKDDAAQQAKKAKLVEEQKQGVAAEAKKSETARIQVRLPDGSSFTQTFASTESLEALYQAVSERMDGAVTLSTTFPKRVFTAEDMSSSFINLQLAPSAVIIAIPKRSGGQTSAVTGSSAGIGNIFMTIFYPLTLLWSFLYSLFFGGSGAGNQSNPQQQQSSHQDSSSSQSGTRSQRPSTAYQRRPQSSGNTRRMTDMREEDDDDKTTYNGNSTQQL